MVYTQRGPIRPPLVQKNWLGSGVKVEISCPLSVWDLAQQTIGINLWHSSTPRGSADDGKRA